MRKPLLPLLILVALCCFSTIGRAQSDTIVHQNGSKEEATSEKSNKRKFQISDYLKIGGYINTQYSYTQQELNDRTLDETSVFQVRRARLDITGDIHPILDFRLQVDFANSPRIMDAYMRVKICKYLNIQAGQFKIPFTIENPYSALDLECIDNAQVITALAGYKDLAGVSSVAAGREIGLQLYGTLLEFGRDAEKYPLLAYKVGVFGGNGINIKTDNMAKDIAGQIDFRPFVKHLTLSGSAYWGRYSDDNMDNLLRLRCTGGAEYKDDRLTVRGEYVWGNTGFSQLTEVPNTEPYFSETRMQTHGFYVVAGYWFNFGWGEKDKYNIQQKLRPVVRYDYYKRDLSEDNSASTYYSVGLDWWPEKHLNFRANYTLRDVASYNKLGHGFSAMLSVKF